MNRTYDYLAIIVIYNKRLSESKTLRSFIDNKSILPANFKFVVWNNGPVDVFMDSSFDSLDIDLINYTTNCPLSKLYNNIFENYLSNVYCIFDDDTVLGEKYFKGLFDVDSNYPWLLVPDILSGADLAYPKNFYTRHYEEEPGSILFVTVMSGLSFNKSLIDALLTYQGYIMDERFALYGVDTTFLLNLQKSNLQYKLIKGQALDHDLSSSSDLPLSDSRFAERCYDQFLMYINYGYLFSNIIIFKESFKILIKIFLRKDFALFIDLLKIVKTKKHPRC